jgi:hypothetical protein
VARHHGQMPPADPDTSQISDVHDDETWNPMSKAVTFLVFGLGQVTPLPRTQWCSQQFPKLPEHITCVAPSPTFKLIIDILYYILNLLIFIVDITITGVRQYSRRNGR